MDKFGYSLEDMFRALQKQNKDQKKSSNSKKKIGYSSEEEEMDALIERSAYGFDGTFRFRMWSLYNTILLRKGINPNELPISAVFDEDQNQTYYHPVAGKNLKKKLEKGFNLIVLGDQEELYNNAPATLTEMEQKFVLGIYTPKGAEVGGESDKLSVMTHEYFAENSPEEYNKFVLGKNDDNKDKNNDK